MVAEFDSSKAVEDAWTPPSSWYSSPSIASLEMDCVFGRGWQVAGYVNQLEKSNDFFTGSLGKIRFVVCKDEAGELQAFHNVCRHHAAPIALGSGCVSSFSCRYHGWTYGMDGKLLKATGISGMKNFDAADHGLLSIPVAAWGPFVLINLDIQSGGALPVADEWLGSASERLVEAGIDNSLHHVARREYLMGCNWKVFCDNYLDGGYHVPYAHPGLASSLDLTSYKTELFETVSIQSCRGIGKGDERLGELATYAFVYPNFMINRYGPWMDTNLVLPVSLNKCRIIFDYFLESGYPQDKEFIEESLQQSDQVQQEDIFLCEEVQKGLESMVYTAGRYAPKVEIAMHHFHLQLHKQFSAAIAV